MENELLELFNIENFKFHINENFCAQKIRQFARFLASYYLNLTPKFCFENEKIQLKKIPNLFQWSELQQQLLTTSKFFIFNIFKFF